MADSQTSIGWDIGGAHVKAATLRHGRLVRVRQWPCALWQGLHLLDAVIDEALAGQGSGARHAVTMTGELVDLFDSRKDGVIRLVRHLDRRLGPGLRLFCGNGDWLAGADAAERWQDLASANWAATARVVASRTDRATLVDIGSTTTDFVPLAGGRVLAVGTSDAQRLQSGELLYQGVIRTPLCALAQTMDFRGKRYNVMNEWFATTADVFRLTGELEPAHDQHPAADGGTKDTEGSCRRIARMIGHDLQDAEIDQWKTFARRWRGRQLRSMRAELQQVESAQSASGANPLVGAGCGSFLVRALAQDLGRDYVDFGALVDAPPESAGWAGVCAPAVAVAMLLEQAVENAG